MWGFMQSRAALLNALFSLTFFATAAQAQPSAGFFENAWNGSGSVPAAEAPPSHPAKPNEAPDSVTSPAVQPPAPPPVVSSRADSRPAPGDGGSRIEDTIARTRAAVSNLQSAPPPAAAPPAAAQDPAAPVASRPAPPLDAPDASSRAKLADQPVIARVRKGSLPSSSEYWRYVNWYRDHAVVSLVVSGDDRAHVVDALAKLYVLRDRHVAIGQVVIIGGSAASELQTGGIRRPSANDVSRLKAAKNPAEIFATVPVEPTELSVIGKKLELEDGHPADGKAIIERLGITYSPAWVVRYHGEDHVFEGDVDPKRLFAADGRFTGGGD